MSIRYVVLPLGVPPRGGDEIVSALVTRVRVGSADGYRGDVGVAAEAAS